MNSSTSPSVASLVATGTGGELPSNYTFLNNELTLAAASSTISSANQANSYSTASDPSSASSSEWSNEEFLHRWRGIFIHALENVLRHVHPQLMAQEEALLYVEELILRLLGKFMTKPTPSTVAEIEDKVSKTFPSPIDKWALTEAQTALEKGKKKSQLVLPVDKVHSMLKEALQNKIDDQVTLYLVAVLEFISKDILKLAGNYVKNYRHVNITCQDIKVAMCADKGQVLMDMFQQDSGVNLLYQVDDVVDPSSGLNQAHHSQKKSQTYEEVVKDIIADEKKYLRDLHMINKVFRDILKQDKTLHAGSSDDMDSIFSNITTITELTVTLISSLEDTLEMTEEGHMPAIGQCFFELAEAYAFDDYEQYARDILENNSKKTIAKVLPKQIKTDALRSVGKGFREAVKFCLPKLLLGPIYHCFYYFNYVELLRKLTDSKEEQETLKEVSSMLTSLKNKLKTLLREAGPAAKMKPGEIFNRPPPGRVSRQQALLKLTRLQQSITNWEGQGVSAHSSELICEGKLKVLDNRKRLVDRYVFLCDGMIIICKQVSGKRHSVSSFHQYEYRLRDKHVIRHLDVLDREDGPSATEKYTFELAAPREDNKRQDQARIIFKAESEEEKDSWMAALVMLNTKFYLERLLDVILANEEKKHPLRFPPKERYPFAEEDSHDNIIFEQPKDLIKSSSSMRGSSAASTASPASLAAASALSGVPPPPAPGGKQIKGATLTKLIERLTYHVYADPMFVKTFLTTFRSFTTPQELLELLINRFNIPEPEFSSDSESDSELGGVDKTNKMRVTQDLKRFRKEYLGPVQFRVINVVKHWVDQHFYDFEQDERLLNKLRVFLSEISVTGKAMKKWVDNIAKKIQQKTSEENCTVVDKEKDFRISFDRSPPPIEIHIEHPEDGWAEVLTYHPIEIARQLTLLEFQYYRAVKPSELVDIAWTREDKEQRSPNLLRMISHTNNFTRYLQKLIVETENLEERVAVMQRTLEIMQVLQEYNNFNGVIAIVSALNSSPVHRLSMTKDRIPNHLLKAQEEASGLVNQHCKGYWEKLRSINPPCVPFFGQYQTNLFFLEEGNPDFLQQNTNLINFTKRRKVAEIISEIQQYQNQPYCLSTHSELRLFLERIKPFPDSEWTEKGINDYLYTKSTEIEPRCPDAAQKKKMLEGRVKWKGLPLRSPGIKPKNLPGKNHPKPLPSIRSSRSRHAEKASSASFTGFGNHGLISSDNDASGTASDSPVTSPIFRNSPHSPSTPIPPVSATGFSSSGAGSPPDHDLEPIKFAVMLPGHSASCSPGGPHSTPMSTSSNAPPPLLPVSAAANPPPLPPKPSNRFYHQQQQYHQHHHFHHQDLPPSVPQRQTSPPPPPLPPRRDQMSTSTPTWRDSSSSKQQQQQQPPPPPSPLL